MDIQEILRHFGGVKSAGASQYRANCPACGDTKGHLYIASAPDGKILLDCKKGCSFGDIISAAGLSASDCFGESPVRLDPWTLLREHVYTDIGGNILGKKQIYDTGGSSANGGGKKQAVWYRLEKGRYVKGLGGTKMPLYHLDKLVKSGGTAVIAEGEKDVETVERLGFTATTSPNGAGSKWRSEWNEFFRGKNVAVLTDNDEAGEKYGTDAASSVCKAAAAVKLIRAADIYPQVKSKGDISDIAAELGDAETRRLLIEAVKNTEPFNAPAVPNQSEKIIMPQKPDENILEVIKKLKPQVRFGYNDRGNGELFAAVFGKTARYNATAKEWFVFKDGYWQVDTGAMQVNGLAKKLYDALLVYASSLTDESKSSYIAHVNKLGRLNVREIMIKDARDRCFIKSEDFDKDPWLFNCRNGTYDLKKGYFRKHDPDDLMSKMTNVFYDENAESPDFEKFLNEIMNGDGEKKRYLLSALGYALTGDASQECMFILYGSTTRNGKGTLMETISYMLGGESGYAIASQPETLARRQNKDSRQASGDIARLKGARFLNVSEPQKNMVFDAALIKTLTGRDTITARHLHEREFQFVPQFKLFINTNHLPHINDDTVFQSDRINVITFDRHFGDDERDTELKDKLRTPENISGIFNICLKGLRDYLMNGLVRPRSVSAATEMYRQQSDRQGVFISECLEADALSSVKAKDVYEVYVKWCGENNFHAENKTNFIAGLRSKNLLTEHATVGGVTWRNVICGYKISDDYSYETPPSDLKSPPF